MEALNSLTKYSAEIDKSTKKKKELTKFAMQTASQEKFTARPSPRPVTPIPISPSAPTCSFGHEAESAPCPTCALSNKKATTIRKIVEKLLRTPFTVRPNTNYIFDSKILNLAILVTTASAPATVPAHQSHPSGPHHMLPQESATDLNEGPAPFLIRLNSAHETSIANTLRRAAKEYGLPISACEIWKGVSTSTSRLPYRSELARLFDQVNAETQIDDVSDLLSIEDTRPGAPADDGPTPI